MVNPGYPPQMQQPGMMPMRPGPGIPMAGAVRKGTPKIVPIVVSAGLAVGVFCGLYFGLGTGEPATAEAGTTSSGKTGVSGPQSAAGASNDKVNFKSGDKPPSELGSATDGSATAGSAATPGSATATTGSATTGSATTPGTGSATTPPPGTGSAATPPPPSGEVKVELTFAITPPDATITIDDTEVTGGKMTITFTGDKKTVRVKAKASGYKTYDKKMTLTKDTTEEAIEIKLGKKGSGGSRPPGGHHDDHDPPGGLIDL